MGVLLLLHILKCNVESTPVRKALYFLRDRQVYDNSWSQYLFPYVQQTSTKIHNRGLSSEIEGCRRKKHVSCILYPR